MPQDDRYTPCAHVDTQVRKEKSVKMEGSGHLDQESKTFPEILSGFPPLSYWPALCHMTTPSSNVA